MPLSHALQERITNDFTYHEPNEVKKELHQYVRDQLNLVAYRLADTVPDGREQALMLTKLEEAMFWANAAIARN